MPFAQPPLGHLRFAPPQEPQPFHGVRQAVEYGAACPQQAQTIPAGLPFNLSASRPPPNVSEDCLFVNVIKPASTTIGDKLPVLFWIYGGAFAIGDTSSNSGSAIVERSLVLGQPIIFVSANYRLNAFGFLASEEVEKAGLGNIGLRDQRFAMEWVNRHISAFGGDPEKVTIWGESAGSFSVGFQLVMNNGDAGGLFRGAVMESGSMYALRNMSAGQPYYDQLVEYTKCSGQADTLDCLRRAPYEQLIAARSVEMGLYAKVPIISGDCDDEGTLFSIGNLNITTDEEFLSYVHSNYIPDASTSSIVAIGEAYSEDPSLGSPFGTGNAYNLTPQYKRLAAFQGKSCKETSFFKPPGAST
ncbi:hypothetical protein AcV7_004733 [Taiwanofungus camphoratus]|nr:hypothetical protein AcV7_004733 [Antrodia cinnamomea]